MKKIIINCDDLGISKETNDTIFESLKQGKASSASILPNSRYFNHACKIIKKKFKKFSFGIHLNLTEGKAIYKNSKNKLSNPKGFFYHTPQYFFFLNNSDKKIIEKSIYNEFRQQILLIKKRGIKISHFDTHQHIHQSKFIFDILVKLGKEFKIKRIRNVNEVFVLKIFFRNFLYKFFNLNYFKFFLIKIISYKKIKFFKSTNYFFGLLNSGLIDKNDFFDYLDNIKNNSTVELCIHPSKIIKKTNKNRFNSFYNSINRVREKELLFSKNFAADLKSRNIKLIKYIDLN